MKGLSDKEIEILLLLVKDFSNDYNSNNITKKIAITSAGAFKAMKNLEKKKMIVGRKMGKAVFYKVNLKDYYAFRTMETLLINEARENASRWIFEFEDLYEHTEIAIIFGSIVKNTEKANDIDLLVVFKREKKNIVKKIIEAKRTIAVKPIHLIKQLPQDLIENLKKKDKAVLNILKSGYALHGYDKLLEAIENVTRI